MTRMLALLYGVVSYVVFLASFLYSIGFVANLFVPKSIDSGEVVPIAQAILINALLLGLFAIQHSVMARRGFKEWWTKIIPASIERSTYVLITSLLLFLIFWQWRPMTGIVWDASSGVAGAILSALFAIGYLLVLLSTFMINHFDLFGLRQVYLNLMKKQYSHLPFETSYLYKFVRHPLLLGFIIAFWATPVMTLGHLVFAAATTGYMLIAIQLEEKDMVTVFGGTYERYREEVPMLIPTGSRSSNVGQVQPLAVETDMGPVDSGAI